MSKADAKKLPQDLLNARNTKRKAEQRKADKLDRAAKVQAKLRNQAK